MLFLIPNNVNPAEIRELEVLGAAFAVSPSLECYSDDRHIRRGFLRARAALDVPQRGPDHFDVIIYYKRPKIHTRTDIIAVDLSTFQRLQVFTNAAQIAAYELASNG